MKKMFVIIFLAIFLLVPLGLSLTPKDVSSNVWIEITKDEIVKKSVNIPLTQIVCKPDINSLKHIVEGSRTLIFLSGDSSGNLYSDVSAKQILDKIKELTGADVNKIKAEFQLVVSGSLLEEREWYVYEQDFRVVEGSILSKKSPRLPNVNPPELIGKFKLEIPEGAEHKFDSKACPNIVDPIPFNSLPEGQKYASANDPENQKLLSVLSLNGEYLTYFSNWELKTIQEDPNYVVFSIDNTSTLSAQAVKGDPELSEQQEAMNFLSNFGNASDLAKKQENKFTIYSLESENNDTKTHASVYTLSGNKNSFGFVYTSPKSQFDLYKDMVEFIKNSIGQEPQQKPVGGPQLTLDVLTQNCKNNIYSINFKLEANHKENINSLEYRIFLDSNKVDSKKIQVNAKRFSSEEIYSFNVSDQKSLEIFSFASAANNSVSHEKETLTVDKNLCDGQKAVEPINQKPPTPQSDNNTLIFVSVIAFLVGLGLMTLIKK